MGAFTSCFRECWRYLRVVSSEHKQLLDEDQSQSSEECSDSDVESIPVVIDECTTTSNTDTDYASEYATVRPDLRQRAVEFHAVIKPRINRTAAIVQSQAQWMFYVSVSQAPLSNIQLGLYEEGFLVPLPPTVGPQYRAVVMTAEDPQVPDSPVRISNDVSSNKLYVKINKFNPKNEKVLVAPNYNQKSYFELNTVSDNTPKYTDGVLYWIKVAYLKGEKALRYNSTLNRVVIAKYDPSDTSFFFTLQEVPQSAC